MKNERSRWAIPVIVLIGAILWTLVIWGVSAFVAILKTVG